MPPRTDEHSPNWGGKRQNQNGRPRKRLMVQLEREWMSKLEAYGREVGMPPDVVAANVVMAMLEQRDSPLPPAHTIAQN